MGFLDTEARRARQRLRAAGGRVARGARVCGTLGELARPRGHRRERQRGGGEALWGRLRRRRSRRRAAQPAPRGAGGGGGPRQTDMAERVSESRLAPGRGTRRPPSVAVAPRRQPAFFGEWPRAACFGSGRGSGERRAHTEGHVSRRGVAVVWPRCGSHERSARERDRGAGAGGDEGGARAHGELCVGARRETAGEKSFGVVAATWVMCGWSSVGGGSLASPGGGAVICIYPVRDTRL